MNRSCFALASILATSLMSCARTSPQADALRDMTLTVKETITVLQKIHTPDEARQAQGQVEVLIKRGQEIQERMKSLIGTKMPLESHRDTRVRLEENEAALKELEKELRRLQQDPAIAAALGEALKGLR